MIVPQYIIVAIISFIKYIFKGLNNENTAEQVFKTSAVAKVPSMDKSQFKVSYHWDAKLGHVDLQKADIEFDSSLITYPSCLDNIQVNKLHHQHSK